MEEKLIEFIDEKINEAYYKPTNCKDIEAYEDFKDVIQWHEIGFEWWGVELTSLRCWMYDAPFYANEIDKSKGRLISYASEGIGQKILLLTEERVEDPSDPDEDTRITYVAMIDSKDDIIRFYEKVAQTEK